jgi:hypothetical protein
MRNPFRRKNDDDIYEILLPGEKSQQEQPFRSVPKQEQPIQQREQRIDEQERDRIFEDVVGYDDIKRVFRMALESDEPIYVLLVGPPASEDDDNSGPIRVILLSSRLVKKLAAHCNVTARVSMITI